MDTDIALKTADPGRLQPTTLTILCTYRCTAACSQCCFESSPKVRGRLSLDIIKRRISEAVDAFPLLSLVVFSGGEAFLLKDDLYEAIKFSTSLGLQTRVVTNGFWGKTEERANACARKLREAGISEINISTGLDHAEFVPVRSVVQAAKALADAEIRTLITVEADGSKNEIHAELYKNPGLRDAITAGRVTLQVNSWMPFHADAREREHNLDSMLPELISGCDQIFETAVVTPHDNLSACCGLTLEHIPEMRLGSLVDPEVTMRDLYQVQYNDFLKYWIKVDGPYTIIRRVLDSDMADKLLEGVVHKCQACAILHKTDVVRDALLSQYPKFVDEVLARLTLSENVLGAMSQEFRAEG